MCYTAPHFVIRPRANSIAPRLGRIDPDKIIGLPQRFHGPSFFLSITALATDDVQIELKGVWINFLSFVPRG